MAPKLMKETEGAARVRDDINPEIQAVLKSHVTPLKIEDFDLRARQCLHAIHGKGGKESVKAALGMVAAWSAGKPDRQSVQKWPAYIGAILRRFLDQFEAQISDAGGESGRMYTLDWKKPASMNEEAQTRTSVTPASSPTKKWWQNMSELEGTQHCHEVQGNEAGLNILACLQGGHRQEKRTETPKQMPPGAWDVSELKHSHKKWQNQWVDTEAEFDLNDGSQGWWWAGWGPSGDWSAGDIKRTQKKWQNSWAESGGEPCKTGARRSLGGGSSSNLNKNERAEAKPSRRSLSAWEEDNTWEPRLRRASASPKKSRLSCSSSSPQKPRRGSTAVTQAPSDQTPKSRTRRATIAGSEPARENSSISTPKKILSSSPMSQGNMAASDGGTTRASAATVTSQTLHPFGEELLMTDDETSDGDEPITNIGEDQAKELPKTSRTRSFCNWLNTRQPLWRFDPVGNGWAWDAPQSKAEKRELLHLSLFAENDVLKKDNCNLNSERTVLCDEVEFLRAELEKRVGNNVPAPR